MRGVLALAGLALIVGLWTAAGPVLTAAYVVRWVVGVAVLYAITHIARSLGRKMGVMA